MPGNRRLGRIIAMQALYEIDAVATDPSASLEALAAEHEGADEAGAFAHTLVQGVLRHLAAIDRVIAEAAPQWPLDQVAGVDRAVLRLAVYELQHAQDAPPKVVINEAVDIAKEYGGEGSGRFINGVLGHVMAAATPE